MFLWDTEKNFLFTVKESKRTYKIIIVRAHAVACCKSRDFAHTVCGNDQETIGKRHKVIKFSFSYFCMGVIRFIKPRYNS